MFCPFRYRLGERRLLGLASGTYFADPEVRGLPAFFLFKRFLGMPGYDFYFANTCNLASGRVWEKCGGRPEPSSDGQWLVPLRFGPLVREVFIRRGYAQLAPLAAALTPIADMLIRRPGLDMLQLEPTDDLQFMASAAEHSRAPELLTPQRDLAYLRWQFVAGQEAMPKEAFRFRDAQGREGWTSIGCSRRGADFQLRCATILDWVAPPEIDFATIVRAVARRFADSSDVVLFRSRPDTPRLGPIPRLRRRNYAGPTAYLIRADRTQTGWEHLLVTSQAVAV
jgi:hypothetical protein